MLKKNAATIFTLVACMLLTGGPAKADPPASSGFLFGDSGDDQSLVLTTSNGQVTLHTTAQGWIQDDDGVISSDGQGYKDNYLVGNGAAAGVGLLGDFFTFDPQSIGGVVTAATLEMYEAGGGNQALTQSGPMFEEFSLSSVPNDFLTESATVEYSQLGSGAPYGGLVFSTAAVGGTEPVPLNSIFIADLNAAETGGMTTFTLGGVVRDVPELSSAGVMTAVAWVFFGLALFRDRRAATKLEMNKSSRV